MRIRRAVWISTVDVLAFISFIFLIATGFLLKYVLPHGSGSLGSGGQGWRAASRPVALVWGMTRDEWGTVHFWLAVAFLAVIALHLFIHWRWIVVSFKGRGREQSLLQAALGIAALIGILLLAASPLVSPKKAVPRGELQELRGIEDAAPAATRGGPGGRRGRGGGNE
jgi:hypothetical protein